MITKNSLTDLENITKLRFCQIIKNKIMSPDYLNMCHVTCHSDFTFSPVPTSNIVSDWTQIGLITIFVPLIQHIFLLLLGHDGIFYCPCWNKISMQHIGFTLLTLTRPSRRKLRMRWFFDVSKVKESSFCKSDLTDPLRFLMRIFWKQPI